MTNQTNIPLEAATLLATHLHVFLMGLFLNLENGLPPLYISLNYMYDNVVVICIICYILFLILHQILLELMNFFPSLLSTALGP